MRKILVCLLLVLAQPSCAQDETVWLKDSSQLDCTPSRLDSHGILTLTLGPDHGRELGVRRHSDNTWYLLVVDSPPDNAMNFMTPELFEAKREVNIPASAMTTEWTTGESVPIFHTNGAYSIYVSTNLESEAGGYVCTIRYVP